MNTHDLLDVAQVAQAIQVKPETVRYYHKMKRMPSADMYFGRSPVWKKETIDAWVAQRQNGTG